MRIAVSVALVEFDAAIPEQVVLEEELHLPSELRLVEGDAVREVDVRVELRAAMLQRRDEPHRFAIQLAVFFRTGEPEMGLQRDVAEILEQQQPEIRRFVEDVGHRHRHLIEQPRDVQERQAVVERRRVRRQHHRLAFGRDQAEIAPIRGVAGERHDAHAAGALPTPPEILLDTLLERISHQLVLSSSAREPFSPNCLTPPATNAPSMVTA